MGLPRIQKVIHRQLVMDYSFFQNEPAKAVKELLTFLEINKDCIIVQDHPELQNVQVMNVCWHEDYVEQKKA